MDIELSEITTSTRGGSRKVLRLAISGEIDHSSAPALREAVAKAVIEEPDRLELDLAGVTFFSCAGVTALFTAQRTAAGRLSLAGAGPPVRRVLRLLGLESTFQTVETGQP